MAADLKFLATSIEQQKLADDSLNQAKQLDQLLTGPSSANWPPEALAGLKQARDGFLSIARQLSTTATVTANNAVIFVDSVSEQK